MRHTIIICLLFITTATIAQNERDSVRKTIQTLNQIYPGIRTYSVQFESPSNRNYAADLFDEQFENGEITKNYRIRTFASIPILQRKEINLRGSINHLYQHIRVDEVSNVSNSFPTLNHSESLDLHDVTVSLTAIHSDSIGNKAAIFSASAMVNSRNVKQVEKFKMLFTATVILKATRNTVMTAGLAGFIDPSAIIPFFPTFTYWHKFPQSNWQFDFILPSRAYMRHPVMNKGWLSIGTEMTGTHSFSTPEQSILTGDYEHSSLLIQSGLNFEYPVSDHFLLGVRGGLENAVTSRMVKVNEKSTNYVSSHKTDPAMFFNVSLSFVPGLKRK